MSVIENSKLLPCPFCGGTKLKIDGKGGKWYVNKTREYTLSVRCNICYARGGAVGAHISFETTGYNDKNPDVAALKEKAIIVWNRRVNNE